VNTFPSVNQTVPAIQETFKLKVCYVLCYYFPQYVRTKTLVDGLTRIEDIKVYKAINTRTGFWRYLESFLKLLWIRLVRSPDFYILGFRGYEIFWLVRLITIPRFLAFDHMMSPYDSLVNETQKLKKGSLAEKLVYLYERSILNNADLVLTDTSAHRNYFTHLFNLPEKKVHPINVGADESLFHRGVSKHEYQEYSFVVFFYGSFLPLHGVNIILNAAKNLKAFPIRFVLVGGNRRDLTAFYNKLKDNKLTNIEHHEWIDYQELPKWMAGANLCLGGPFGDTGQGHRVISGKTFQSLAMAKPTVVGKTKMDSGFVDKKNCLLVPQGDPKALAEAVLWAYHNQEELDIIGMQGHELYRENFSLDSIRGEITQILESCKSL
jgi:glycosyltransferase involved in cell wall biosynthesis